MKTSRSLQALLGGVAVILLAAALGGCFNANVDTKGWQGVARDYKDAYAPANAERDKAIQAARETAIENGLTKARLEDYDVSASRDGQLWWIAFRLPRSDGDRWPEKFLVRVSSDNRTVLYRDPAKAPPH